MLRFLVKNHLIPYILISFFVLIISTVSMILAIHIIEMEQIKGNVKHLDYKNIFYNLSEAGSYNYHYEVMFQTKNFSLNNKDTFNAFMLMQSESYTQETDLLSHGSLDIQLNNLKHDEIVLSQSLMNMYNLKISDTVTLNGLNPIQYKIIGSIEDNIYAFYQNEILNVPIAIIAYDENHKWSGLLLFSNDIYYSSSFIVRNDTLIKLINIRSIQFNLTYLFIYVATIMTVYMVLNIGLDFKNDMTKYKECGYEKRKIKGLVLMIFLSVVPWLIPFAVITFTYGLSVLLLNMFLGSLLALYAIWRLLI